MRDFLINLLKELELRVPPPPNCHHCITYAQFGSDKTGWEDRLALQVNRDGKFRCFFLDEDDLLGHPHRIIEFIEKSYTNPDPTFTPQEGVGTGQYIK